MVVGHVKLQLDGAMARAEVPRRWLPHSGRTGGAFLLDTEVGRLAEMHGFRAFTARAC